MSEQHKLLFQEDQLTNIIALYQSYVTNIDANLITQKEMQQKGDLFLQWVNDLLASKIKKINQIAQHSIDVFRHLAEDQIQISNKFLQMEHQNTQKSTLIENHLYTIKNIQTKLAQRQNDIEKLRLQITQLTQKIDKQQSKFKRQAKQFKKTFRIIQQQNENDKQIFDSVKFQYEHERSQKDLLKNDLIILKDQYMALKKQHEQTKRILKASQNKLQWEVKKKISLQEVVKEKNQMIEKLLMEITDLKQTLKQSDGAIDSQHLHEKYFDQENQKTLVKSMSKNILSQQMAFRQSFSSQMDMDDQFVRKNSLRKSFDQGSANIIQGQFDYVNTGNDEGIFQYGNKRSLYEHGNNSHTSSGYLKSRSNKSSFYQQEQINGNIIKEQPSSKISSNQKLSVNRSPSPNSIFIKEHNYDNNLLSPPPQDQNGTMSMRRRSPSDTSSPEIHRFEPTAQQTNEQRQQHQQDELQIITQKVQSGTQKSIEQKEQQPEQVQSFRRYVPDLYFAHFLLTSQSVKIKQDCEQMLNIDVKQYYGEVVQKRVPMHVWDDWIRDKLRIAVKAIKEKYQQHRRSSISSRK